MLPSYLKRLVESRARAAGDIERLEELRRLLEPEIETAPAKLQAAGTLIRDFSPLPDPSQIQPIKPREGRHGKLRETVRQILRDAAPEALPTNQIAFLAAEKMQLRFHTADDFRTWAANAVARELRKQSDSGALERLPVPGEENRWHAVAAGQPRTSADLHLVQSGRPARS